MKKEIEITEDVINYLKSLGYSESNIKYDVSIGSFKRVDLVVTSDNENIIAIEVKSNLRDLDEIGEIAYNPAARQIQRSAQELGAKNYLLSNGTSHIWMETGPNGRPKEINPIKAGSEQFESSSDRNYIISLLDHVSSFLINHPITGNHSKDFSISIYSKLINDLNLDKTIEPLKFANDKIVGQALERMRDVNFANHKIEILEYLDNFLLNNKNDWQLPRWLANLMVNLYPKEKDKNRLLDLYAKYGIIASSAQLSGWRIVDNFYTNQDNTFWIKCQEILSDGINWKSTFSQDLLSDHHYHKNKNAYDCILIAPPFGLNVSVNYQQGKISSVEVLLKIALEYCKPMGYVISLVPDSVLLSSKYKSFRRSIIKEYSIKGIINLTPDTFKPYSSVSTSILIIKKNKSENQKVFFASLDGIPRAKDISNNKILLNWNGFSSNLEVDDEKNGFIVRQLENSNFHFSNYFFNRYHEDNLILEGGFQAIPLKEIVQNINRGNSFKKDEKEEFAYIAPATVRTMNLKEEGLSFTSNNKVPKKSLKTKIGDVLVNIIGTQKGSAALVTTDFEGLGFNQHIVRLDPKIELIRPLYLAIALNCDYVQKQLEKGSTGSVIPSLSLKSFESIYIPVPPLFLQDKICTDYTERKNLISQKEADLNEHKSKLNRILFDLGKEGTSL